MVEAVRQRQERLLALLDERGELDVPSLVRELNASEATLRRDLAALEEAGQLVRTFGGARSLGASSLVGRTFGEKRRRMRKEKEAIGRSAACMVEPGMVVALDSGTTVWRIAACLRDIPDLKIITTAMAAVEELGPSGKHSVLLAGGTFRLKNLDFAGPSTIAQLGTVRADIAFVGADSFVPGRGAFSVDETSAALAAALARCADHRVLVMDHSKFGASGSHLILAPAEIDCLITDSGLAAPLRSRIEEDPYKVILAD